MDKSIPYGIRIGGGKIGVQGRVKTLPYGGVWKRSVEGAAPTHLRLGVR